MIDNAFGNLFIVHYYGV